ncbi:uncharacterized protein LOC108905610 [Anoplophora glabripennis]|nr:uncharacterized protein LOC108905610 [Anoplophora glabripennis]
MAAKSVICCVITILIVNANTVFSVDLPESLGRYQKAILSKNPSEELNNIINQDLSRTSVHSYVKSLIPHSIENLRQAYASEDLLEILVRKYTEDQRVKEAASNNDIQSVLDVLNSEIGGVVLVISNSSIVVDVDALAEVFRTYTKTYINQLYPGNFYLQIVANTVVDEQIKVLIADLKSLLVNKGIPVNLVGEIISLISNSGRAKRDLVIDLILSMLRPQIAVFLTPIQTEFNTIVNEILTVILSFYSASAQSNPIFDIIANFVNVVVLRVAEVIVVIQTDVNNLFDNIINGTIVTTSRKRRDVDLEFENFYNLESVALQIPHRRVTRDIISDIFTLVTDPISLIFNTLVSPITNILNIVIKNVFIFILSSQYETIGSLVTLPLRLIVNTVIDTILSCTDCISIV